MKMILGRTELCAWLRANSSGIYRPAADAADEIEHLAAAKDQHFAQAMANGAAANELRAELEALRKDAERYRKLVACGKYAAASIGGGWGLAHSGVFTGRSSKAELDAAADALPAVGDA